MVEYDPQERELVKTLDIKLIPFLTLLYFFILTDRSNQLHTGLPNLQTEENLKTFLGIDSGDSGVIWSLFAFSIGSLLATLPVTLSFRRLGPSISFAIMLVLWGLTMILTGVVKSYPWFVFARLCLGVFQAGFVPCILLYIMSFYTKEESATRIAYVMSMAALSQSFSELISDYTAQIKNSGGLSGWQWFYVIEGIIGLILAVATWLYLPSFPETCKFLNPADRVLAVARGRDGYDKEETSLVTKTTHVETRIPSFRFSFVQFIDIAQDLRIWLLAITYLFVVAGLDLMIVATPEISANSFGIVRTCVTNCSVSGGEEELDLSHGIPLGLEFATISPYAIGLFASYFVSNYSDNSNSRINCIVLPLMLSFAGFISLALWTGPATYFLGVFPAIVGLVSSVPSILAYSMEHASGDTQRATVASISIGLGQSLGLLVTALVQLTHSTPSVSHPAVHWFTSFTIAIGILCVFGVQRLNDAEQQNAWGKAPGLRRLLNDADEAKAWDIELNNVDDFVKSNPLQDAWGSVDEM